MAPSSPMNCNELATFDDPKVPTLAHLGLQDSGRWQVLLLCRISAGGFWVDTKVATTLGVKQASEDGWAVMSSPNHELASSYMLLCNKH